MNYKAVLNEKGFWETKENSCQETENTLENIKEVIIIPLDNDFASRHFESKRIEICGDKLKVFVD